MKSALDRLGRGRRNTRAATLGVLAIAGVGAAGLAAAKGYAWLTRATPTPVAIATTPPPPTTAPPTPTATATPTTTPRPTHTIAERPSPTPAVSAAPSPASTRLALIPSPIATAAVPTPTPLPAGMGGFHIAIDVAAEVYLDGNDVGPTALAKAKVFPLAPGSHALRVVPSVLAAKNGCQTLDARVFIVEGVTTGHIILGNGPIGRDVAPEDIYFNGCRVPFQLDLGAATSAVTEVLLDGKEKLASDEKGWIGVSGPHDLEIHAKGYETKVMHVELRARQHTDDKLPVVTAELVPIKH